MRTVGIMGELFCCLVGSTEAKTIVVAADGSGEFKTLQEAITAAPEGSTERTVIQIKAGTYEGPFAVPKKKSAITFEGAGTDKTILTYDKNVYETIPPGHDKFNPSLHVQGEDFRAEKLTIQNTSGDHGQRVAARVDGDKAVFKDCRMLGWQDTVMANNGRQYFKDCYIEGRVDFLYGSGTAVFENCHVHSKNGGYVTATNTPENQPFGFVFLNCKLTGDAIAWNPATTNPATTQKAAKPNKMAYLGRPWREFAAVTFINCEMGDHIRPEGWHNWGKPEKEKTTRYFEYGSTGPGGASDKRVGWAKKLTKEEADKITVESVLGGKDNWDPSKE